MRCKIVFIFAKRGEGEKKKGVDGSPAHGLFASP